MQFTLIFISQIVLGSALLYAATPLPAFLPCTPESEIVGTSISGEPSPQFCAKWNPDFGKNGQKCCGPKRGYRRKQTRRVIAKRFSGYCTEVTSEQKEYASSVELGKTGDILKYLKLEMGKRGDQAYCSVNNGFLAFGRPILPTVDNSIVIKAPGKCVNFGTDAMAGMLEWLGREVKREYSGYHLHLGDISGPKGGGLIGRSGRRGHASHTTGQDADVGFLNKTSSQAGAGNRFERHMDLASNWWFLKRVFKNPFACIKVIFLDRRHISMLAKFAKNDSEWNEYKRFIRHMPGHKNHFHLRIGKGPGLPGCSPNAHPELEFEEDVDPSDFDETTILDEIKSMDGAKKL